MSDKGSVTVEKYADCVLAGVILRYAFPDLAADVSAPVSTENVTSEFASDEERRAFLKLFPSMYCAYCDLSAQSHVQETFSAAVAR